MPVSRAEFGDVVPAPGPDEVQRMADEICASIDKRIRKRKASRHISRRSGELNLSFRKVVPDAVMSTVVTRYRQQGWRHVTCYRTSRSLERGNWYFSLDLT